jgi:surface antigen
MAFAFAALGLATRAEDKEKPKHTIKAVMKACMKDGLCGKVAGGKASDDEKKALVENFEALAANKPPKGSADSWKEKTSALVDAAKAAAAGKEGAEAKLKAAANCMACHKEHKG